MGKQDARESIIERPSEYAGEKEATVAATQNDSLPPAQKRRIVEEWMEFFTAGPSPIKRLTFTTRTPRRLFETLIHQTQLEQLEVKWGDYQDLSPIREMPRLHTLRFQSAPALRTLEPLTSNGSIHTLEIAGLRDAHDMSPLGTMTSLRDLVLGGDFNSLRMAHIGSLDFLHGLPRLERLALECVIVDSKDYTPLLSLPELHQAWVMECRGMRPSAKELSEQVPGWQN